jgi:MFS family permease
MYISSSAPPGRAFVRSVPAIVFVLGTVSLITDVSAEMVTAVLPLYLMLAGLGPLQIGLLDGLYAAVTAVVRLAGGHAADRWRRRKWVASAGYGLSALAKLGLLLAGGSVAGLSAAVVADRIGKGVRTAPRDALISLATPAKLQGQAFGVHRTMDTIGALLGPLAAVGVLAASGGSYQAVFVASFCVAALGVAVLVLYVRDRPESTPWQRMRLRELRTTPGFARICVAATLLGVVTVSDFFVYLLLQRRLDLAPTVFPLLPLGTAAAYLLLAIPLGRHADKRGRASMFLGGHLGLIAAYLLLAGAPAHPLTLVAVLGLHGLFYAATDGVLMAMAGPALSQALRTSGLAVLQTVKAAAQFGSSIVFGAMWARWDARTGLLIMAAGMAVALLAARKVISCADPSSSS